MTPRFWLHLTLFVAVTLLAGCPRDQDSLDRPSVDAAPSGETIASHTSGVISRDAAIRVRFTSDLRGDEEGEGAVNPSPFRLQPAAEGQTIWTGARTLQFHPNEPLKAGEEYKVTFDPSGVPGLEDRVAPFAFVVNVMPQSFDLIVDGLTPAADAEQGQELAGAVLTADTASTQHVESMLAFQHGADQLAVSWRHDLGQRRHAFTVSGVRRRTDESRLEITADGTAIGVDRKETRSVAVPGLNQFSVLRVTPVTGDARHVEARFSDPLAAEQDLRGLIHSSDNATLRFAHERGTLRIYRADAWPRETTLVFEPGVTNADGHALRERASFTVSFEPLKPAVRFVGKGVILPSTAGLTIPIETANLAAIDVQAIRVHESNLSQFLQVNPIDGDREMRRVGELVWTSTVPLPTSAQTENRYARHALDLSPLVEKSKGGLYQIRLSFRPQHSRFECPAGTFREDFSGADDELEVHWGDEPERSYWDYFETYYADSIWAIETQPWQMWRNRDNPCHPAYFFKHHDHDIAVSRNVMVSDVGLIAKHGEDDSLLIAVTDLRTAEHRVGAKVSVLDFQRQEIASGVTGTSGIIRLRPEREPFLVVARHDGSTGLLRLEEGSALAVGHLDVSGAKVSAGLKGLIYGERGVWRPGDEIFLTFVLHDVAGRMPDDHPISFELIDSRGRPLERRTVTSSVSGFYHIRTRTEPDAPTGSYLARVRAGGATFEQEIKVETIIPNRLKIELDLPEDQVIQGPEAKLSTTLTSAWLHGAPARRLRADMEMTLRPTPTRFDRFEGYSFDDPTRQFQPETRSVFQGTLAEDGTASVDATFDTGRPPGMLTAHLATRVFEPSGAFSADHFTVPVSPYQRYLGVKTPPGDRARGMLLTDQKHPVSIVAVDAAGEPVDGVDVDVSVYKISWRWWWESGPEQLPDYAASASHQPVQQSSVRLENGRGVFELEVEYPSWGRYLVLARDSGGGHRAGRIVYIDWPGWAGRAMEDRPGGASVLSVSSDKTRYSPGETAVITVPTPHRGRALVTLETGSTVLDASWLEATGEITRHEVPIEAYMAPGVYVNVSLLQPHLQDGNDLPMRLYGVVPLEVEDPRTRLSPRIETAEVFEPQAPAEVEVSEADGRPMAYTLAVVDEGLLGLTRFRTPDLWSQFYRREALGVTSWDMFDHVAGAFGGSFERLLAIGGGDHEDEAQDQKADRFPPVVRFLGPFDLDAGEQHRHVIDMPQYVGAVRVMVVAGKAGAFGSTEKTVPVRKPLMVLATLPRVLGPGEETDLPVAVFALDEAMRDVTLEVETSDGLELLGDSHLPLRFDQIGDQMAFFRLRATETLGPKRVRVIAKSRRERAVQEIEIDVRHPGTRETRILAGVVEPGATWNPELVLTGMSGSHEISLETSRMSPIDLGARLGYLIGYPHGCLEQVMSRVFVQLHLPRLMELGHAREAEVNRNVRAGVSRVAGFQLPSGGFGYWQSQDQAHDWTTSYVGHFLLDAQEAGYPVPGTMLQRWESYQRGVAQSFQASQAERADLAQAYRLYTLALAGRPEIGAMNRLREAASLSDAAKWRLAAAYQLAGQPDAARTLVSAASAAPSEYRELGNTFGSALRDRAMILETAVLMGDERRVGELLPEISSALSSGEFLSTQETAFALVSLARAMDRFGKAGEMRFAYRWNGKREERKVTSPFSTVELAPATADSPELSVQNQGDTTLFARLMISGLPEVGRETAAESGLRMQVEYRTLDGEELTPGRLEQGTDFVARVTVTNTRRAAVSELALGHIVPSGWEIRNERMSGGGSASSAASFDHQDIRDDRVLTYFGLAPGQSRTFEVRLHSAYAGRFYLPGINVEAMYDAALHARTTGAWIEVIRPGLTG